MADIVVRKLGEKAYRLDDTPVLSGDRHVTYKNLLVDAVKTRYNDEAAMDLEKLVARGLLARRIHKEGDFEMTLTDLEMTECKQLIRKLYSADIAYGLMHVLDGGYDLPGPSA
jgi:hypothetical protein